MSVHNFPHGLTLASADQHKYTVTPLQIVTGKYRMWKSQNNEMQSSNVQNCVLRLSQDELSWAFIYPGNVFLLSRHVLLHTCSFLALLYFTVRLLYTVDPHLGAAQCSHSVPLSGAVQLHSSNSVSNLLLKSTSEAVSAARWSLIRSLTSFSQLVGGSQEWFV